MSAVQHIVDEFGPSIRHINLMETVQSNNIASFLREQHHAEELPKAQLFRENSEEFRSKFIEFMGDINVWNSSLHWWAMSFTNKYSLTLSFCRNVFHVTLIDKIASQSEVPLLVITTDRDIPVQMQKMRPLRDARIVNYIKGTDDIKSFIKRCTPVSLVRVLTRSFLLRSVAISLRPNTNMNQETLIIATHTHSNSVDKDGEFHDAYFGELSEIAIKQDKNTIVLGLLYDDFFRQMRAFKKLKYSANVVPIDCYFTLKGWFTCALVCLGKFIKPIKINGNTTFGDLDLTFLLERAIKESCRSGDLFWNLRIYYCAKRLSEKVKVRRCLYPFENRAWEKMLITGMRLINIDSKMCGYQHTSITRSHTNFQLSRCEADSIPLPDQILTTGNVTKAWLEKEGNYPNGIFKSACALRHSRPYIQPDLTTKRPIKNILVALATSFIEYVQTIEFLQTANLNTEMYIVKVRPHPILSLQSALDIFNIRLNEQIIISEGSLEDDLIWADVVLYASSTVGMQAVSGGIPAIHLDLGEFLDTDPMFDWDDFKWSAKAPEALVDHIKQIDALSDEHFTTLQLNSKSYVDQYLSPVSDEALKLFLAV